MGKERATYGQGILVHKTMDLKISCSFGKYSVMLANVSNDLLILLSDMRNKMRLTNAIYFMYGVYTNIEIDMFVGSDDNYKDTKTYTFFINSLSKSKVVLTLSDVENTEDFIIGGDLTEEERERLKSDDRQALEGSLEEYHNKIGFFKPPLKRWNKTKYKKEED